MHSFEKILQEGTLKEGTWEIKSSYKDEAISRIEELKDWLYDKFGSDSLFDNLDNSIKIIRELTDPNIERVCDICRQTKKGVAQPNDDWYCNDCIERGIPTATN